MTIERKWADAHSHLSDLRIPDVHQWLKAARAKGLQVFLQGGVGPEDWQRQKELARQEPGVLPVFGLHPYWVADHTLDECEQALDQLARELPKAAALGETGLDFRTHIIKDSRDRQIQMFEAQLELARMADLPVVLHIVRAFDEAIQVLDLFGQGNCGLVHAFTGSALQAKAYLDRGFYISVGGPLCRPEATRLEQAVASIPMERLLIETDSPDQPPPSLAPGLNQPVTVFEVAEKVSQIKKVSLEEVLDKTSQNLAKLLDRGQEWNSLNPI